MAATSNNSLQYWKVENLHFVPTADTGEVEPALVFPTLDSLRMAIRELKEEMSPDDPLWEAMRPEDDADLMVEFIRLCMGRDPNNETCLIWVDRSRQPRLEFLGSRSTKTLMEAFWAGGWVLRQGQNKPVVLEALSHLVQRRGSKVNSQKPSATTKQASATMTTAAHTAAPTESTVPQPMETAKTSETEKDERKNPPKNLLPAQKENSVEEMTTGQDKSTAPESDNDATAMQTEEQVSTENAPTEGEKNASMKVETETDKEMESMQVENATENDAPTKESSDSDETEKATQQKSAVESEDNHWKETLSTKTPRMESPVSGESGVQEVEMANPVTVMTTPSKKEKSKSAPSRVSMSPVTRSMSPAARPKRATRGAKTTKPTIQDDDDRQFVYVPDKEATAILRKGGFKITRNHCSLPDDSASFESLDDLRADLRRNGLDDCDHWSDKERATLQRWIRWSILRSDNYETGVPSDEEVPVLNFHGLMKLGFQYKSSPLYMYPDVDASKANLLTPGAFNVEDDLAMSLAAEGVPGYLYDQLTRDQLLGIEKYADERAYIVHERNLFERKMPSPEMEMGRRSRRGQSSESGAAKTKSTSPNKKSPNKKSPNKKRRTTPTKTKKPTPTKKRKTEPEEASTPTTMVTHVTTEASVDALPWPPTMDPIREIVGENDHERLTQAVASLKQSGSMPVFSEDSAMGKNLKRVQDMIQAVIRSVGRHGGKHENDGPSYSKALYVCGVPGTGKTMSLSWICKHVIKLHEEGKIGVERDDDDEGVKWKCCYVNVTGKSDPDEVRKAIGSELGCKPNEISSRLKRRKGLILIVDEVDGMLKTPQWKRLLQNLIGSANNEEQRFAFIGISNSLMDAKYAEIMQLGEFRESMTFPAYSEADLIAILRHRVGNEFMDEKAMQFIARKCVGEGGDARKTTDMARTVVEACLDRVDPSTVTPGPLVTMKHVAVLNRNQARAIADQIQGLPQVCKFCLYVLSTLGKMKVTDTTLGKLQRFVMQCMSEDDLLTAEDFAGCLETLHDSGLLRMDKANVSGLSLFEKMHLGIRLGYQLEDVQFALEKVCKGDIYQRLAKRVEVNRDEL